MPAASKHSRDWDTIHGLHACLQGGDWIFLFSLLLMAMQRMAHTDGENATARAAAKLNIPMVRDPAQVNQTQGFPADRIASHQPIFLDNAEL